MKKYLENFGPKSLIYRTKTILKILDGRSFETAFNAVRLAKEIIIKLRPSFGAGGD